MVGQGGDPGATDGDGQAVKDPRVERVMERIESQEELRKAEVTRTAKTYQAVKWLAVIASAAPAILVAVFEPSGTVAWAIGIASVVGTLLILIEGHFGWRARWMAARKAWDEVRQLGDQVAVGKVPVDDVADKLEEVRGSYTRVLGDAIRKDLAMPAPE
jgi:hypothetical protein